MENLIAFFLLMALWPVAAWWRGYVLMQLWSWYIVPSLHVPSLSIFYAVGIMLIWSLLNSKTPKPSDKDGLVLFFEGALWAFLIPGSALGFGYLWQWLQWGM